MMIEYSFLCETELLIQKYQSDLVFVLSQPGVQVSLLNKLLQHFISPTPTLLFFSQAFDTAVLTCTPCTSLRWL